MIKPYLLLIGLLMCSSSASSQVRCDRVYEKPTPSTASLTKIFDGIDLALQTLRSESFKPTKQEFTDFGRGDSSFKALTYFEGDHTTAITRIWTILMREAFHAKALENQQHITRAEGLYDQYDTIFKAKVPFQKALAAARKGKTSRAGKLELIELLKMYSHVVTSALGREFNLLRQSDLFELFGVTSRKELEAKVRENENEYAAFLSRIQEYVVNKTTRNRNAIEVELITHFFKDEYSRPFTPKDRSFFKRNGGTEEAQNLIILLRLPESQQEAYLNDLLILQNSHPKNNEIAQRNLRRMNTLLVMRAAEEVYGKLSFIYNRNLEAGFFNFESYIQLRQLIEGSETARIIVEEKMSDYLDKSDALNARITSLHNSLLRIERDHSQRKEEVDELLESLASLEIKDFDRNIDRRSSEVTQIEVQVDRIREEIATQTRRENIEDFYDLNNRWQRLIPGKNYNLEGIDYSKVTFEGDVIRYFSDNPMLGARYLASLTKSYVAIKKESGLRRFPNIHSAMRDIKIIRKHGKIRVVGKLVGETIHFFHIYASEKPYNNKQMEMIVDHFNP